MDNSAERLYKEEKEGDKVDLISDNFTTSRDAEPFTVILSAAVEFVTKSVEVT